MQKGGKLNLPPFTFLWKFSFVVLFIEVSFRLKPKGQAS